MDKFDLIQADIEKQKVKLEELEDNYRLAKKEISHSFDELENNRSQLNHLFDDFSQLFSHFSIKGDSDNEAVRDFSQLLENYIEATELAHRQQREKLESKDEKITSDYHQAYAKTEEKLEKSYRLRKLASEQDI